MQKKIRDGVFLIFVLALFILVFNRTHYGVDLADEAYNIALPYRFALGDTPFVDEMAPQQTSSLLLFPIIKSYTHLFGTESLILFMRYMYLIFATAVALIIYGTLRERLGGNLSFMISFLVVLYAPYGAIFFNYNRLAFLLFSAGCFVGVLRRKMLFWSGMLHGLTVIAYPFFAIPCTVFFLIQAVRYRNIKTFHYVYGALIPLLAFLAVVLWIGLDNLLNVMWSLRIGIHGGGVEKLTQLLLGIWNQVEYKWVILLYCIGVFTLSRKYRQASIALAMIPLIPFCAFRFPSPTAPSWYFITFGLFAPYLMLFVSREATFLWAIFLEIWLPSFIAGMTTGFISAGGAINFGIGIVPGVLVTVILLVCILRAWASDIRQEISGSIPGFILIILLVFQYSFVYAEGSYSTLSERIEYGPYRGLYTSLPKKQYVESLIQDVEKFEVDQGKVIFFDFFPAGYLFTTMRPASNLVWSPSPQMFNTDRDLILSYYADRSNLPDVSVRIKLVYTHTGAPLELEYSEDDALVDFVRQVNPKTYHGPYWDIYYGK